MARTGVTYDEVVAAADGLMAENINPTINNVRNRLGTGSHNTIHRHLTTWRTQLPQIVTTNSEVPQPIAAEIMRELIRVKSEARAEVTERLVICQDEAAELAARGEVLELEVQKLKESVEAAERSRVDLMAKLLEKEGVIERLTHENERERYATEQARLMAAQMRNKVEDQTQKIAEISSQLDELKSNNIAMTKAKTSAEKDAAVLATRLEYEQKANNSLKLENDKLHSRSKTSNMGNACQVRVPRHRVHRDRW